ncbi:MAG TPA: hypothetical protein VF446_05255 [Trinickia sp.]
MRKMLPERLDALAAAAASIAAARPACVTTIGGDSAVSARQYRYVGPPS